MRIARIHHGGRPVHAVVEGDSLALLDDLPGSRRSGGTLPLAGARLLAPADPRVVLGMAHNTGPADRLLPPQAFLKPSRTVVGPGAPIPLPDGIGHVDGARVVEADHRAPPSSFITLTMASVMWG